MTAGHTMTMAEKRGRHGRQLFTPGCTCGWAGVGRRRRPAAAALYREHAETGHRDTAAPRPTTPLERLPEVLR